MSAIFKWLYQCYSTERKPVKCKRVFPLSLEIHSSSVFGKLVEINFWFILHMDLSVIICKVNVKCFCTVNWLACFVSSNVNISTGSCGRGLHYLQDNLLSVIPTPLDVKLQYLSNFCECVRELQLSGKCLTLPCCVLRTCCQSVLSHS